MTKRSAKKKVLTPSLSLTCRQNINILVKNTTKRSQVTEFFLGKNGRLRLMVNSFVFIDSSLMRGLHADCRHAFQTPSSPPLPTKRFTSSLTVSLVLEYQHSTAIRLCFLFVLVFPNLYWEGSL